jgi:hypothetical protein
MAEGVSIEVLHPTAKSQRERFGHLQSLIKQAQIRIPEHEQLRRELLNLMIEVTAAGWRVTDPGSTHNDHAVALAGACWLARETVSAPLPEQPAEPSRWEAVRPDWHQEEGSRWKRF